MSHIHAPKIIFKISILVEFEFKFLKFELLPLKKVEALAKKLLPNY